MKSSIVRVLVTLSLSAILSPIALLAQGPLQAVIPFDFTVGAKTLPAGDYTVRRLNGNIILIQNSKTSARIFTMPVTGEAGKKPGVYSILFNRYGDSYFLAAVRVDDWGWEWKKTAAEKELIAKAASPKPVIVAAK